MDLVRISEMKLLAFPGPGEQDLLRKAACVALKEFAEGTIVMGQEQISTIAAYVTATNAPEEHQNSDCRPILLRTTDHLELLAGVLERAYSEESDNMALSGLKLACELRTMHDAAVAPIREAANQLSPEDFADAAPSKRRWWARSHNRGLRWG